jgi:hypothetical protein
MKCQTLHNVMFALIVQTNMNIPKLIMLDFQERGDVLPTFTTKLLVNSVESCVFIHRLIDA